MYTYMQAASSFAYAQALMNMDKHTQAERVCVDALMRTPQDPRLLALYRSLIMRKGKNETLVRMFVFVFVYVFVYVFVCMHAIPYISQLKERIWRLVVDLLCRYVCEVSIYVGTEVLYM